MQKLGKARILTVQQLRIASCLWLHIDGLSYNRWLLTADEHEWLISWLDTTNLSLVLSKVTGSDDHEPAPSASCSTPPPVDCQTELEYLPDGIHTEILQRKRHTFPQFPEFCSRSFYTS